MSGGIRTVRVRRVATVIGILAVGNLLAFAGEPFWVQIAIGIFIAAVISLAWDIPSRTGQVSLGSAAFFGLGAYGSALLEPVLGIILAWIGAAILCGAAAVLVGLVTLRLRRMYFTIATLGFTLSLQVVMLMAPDITGGAGGIAPPLLMDGDPRWQLSFLALLLAGAALISDILSGVQFRPAFFMIRSNPDLAAASGVRVVRTKIIAFGISGVLCGLAGACYGGLYGYVTPADVFTLNWSVLPLASTILGGMDTTLGPILGAALLRLLEEVARAVVGGVGYQVVYGAVIMLCVLLMPAGVVGLLKHRGDLGRRILEPLRKRPVESGVP